VEVVIAVVQLVEYVQNPEYFILAKSQNVGIVKRPVIKTLQNIGRF